MKFPLASLLGLLITSTDYDYTLRPKPGTQILISLGEKSFVDLKPAPN